ncbi:MAG: quinone-dependent dihydroorotate dehydrogenase [Pseudomonadota bacterium]
MNLFQLFQPAVFALSPERAHEVSISALRSGFLPAPPVHVDDRLHVELAGLIFPNPVGLAAGFDKNAEVPDAILKHGFGFTEVGTITPKPQTGNPKPRVFRLVEDKGVINRLGFNNYGHEIALKRLNARRKNHGIVGVNIGANKDSSDFVSDYEKGIETFYPLATYFTANISSPNTPGLRNLQGKEALEKLLSRIFAQVERCEEQHGRKVPVFLKVAPDIDEAEIDDIAEVVLASSLSALIVSNTTLDRDNLKNRLHASETGGLSGKPLFEKSTRVLAQFYKRIGKTVPLIGVGGIGSISDAITKLEAGATLLQLYTGMIYEGPNLAHKITKGLSRHLDATGGESITALTGSKSSDWA